MNEWSQHINFSVFQFLSKNQLSMISKSLSLICHENGCLKYWYVTIFYIVNLENKCDFKFTERSLEYFRIHTSGIVSFTAVHIFVRTFNLFNNEYLQAFLGSFGIQYMYMDSLRSGLTMDEAFFQFVEQLFHDIRIRGNWRLVQIALNCLTARQTQGVKIICSVIH